MDRFVALQTFVSVYEAGSFSAAAQRLKIGQPAVSKTVAQLEKHLGVLLFLRSTRSLTPTEAGEQFYQHAQRALEELDEAESAARGARARLSGRLRICAAVTFARLHIVPHLNMFLDQYPELDIDVMLDDRNIDLLEEGIDVALRMGELADSGMSARKLGRGRRMVVATPSYLARQGEPATPGALAAHRAIVYGRSGGGATWTFRQGADEVAVTLSGRVVINAAEGVRAAVLSDLGLAISSEWMFAPELKAGTVTSVLNDWQLPPIDLWAVYPAGRLASAKARAFVDFVESLIASTPGFTP